MLVVLVLAFSGCAPVQAPQSTPQPTPEPTPEAVPVLTLKNPVEEFWDAFDAALLPLAGSLQEKSSAGELQYLDKSLVLAQHIQRLQQIFYALTGLGQVGDDITGWSGLIADGAQGNGSIRTAGAGYAFTCTLGDTSVIEGTLQRGTLKGEWRLVDGNVRAARILIAQDGWLALCAWEDTQSLLYVTDGALWFAQHMDELPYAGQEPASWADWGWDGDKMLLGRTNREG